MVLHSGFAQGLCTRPLHEAFARWLLHEGFPAGRGSVALHAGMMIRPRTEGLDVTFNVSHSHTWLHYVRALHAFLERECTGGEMGGHSAYWEGLGGMWSILGGTGRPLMQTGRSQGPYWEALGGPKVHTGSTGRPQSPYWEALGGTGRSQGPYWEALGGT